MIPAMAESSQAQGIRLAGLRRDYGERTALADVTLELAPGTTLAVLGPNGAGKTTLLRVLATLLRPTAGSVNVLGCELPREAWRLRGRIGYLGHDPLLYRDLSGRENLRFSARLHGIGGETAERRIGELIESVAMERHADRRVGELSAGMRQRLAVCRCVLHRPELLLLDEPNAHLDPEGRALAEPLIGAAAGRTRVVVSHDTAQALREGERVLALDHGGEVAFEGATSGITPETLTTVYAGESASAGLERGA
jgi:heme ABC exporter ATP-binding subunit CcmA